MDELLKLLEKNALEDPADIAKMLNTSEAEIRARIKNYEANGIIRGYRAVLNKDEMDLDCVSAVIEVKITPDREGGFNTIAERIAQHKEVESVFLMSGAYDLLVFVRGTNLKEVAGFVSAKLATIEGVISTSTHFMLKTYKDQGVLMKTEKQNERLKVSP